MGYLGKPATAETVDQVLRQFETQLPFGLKELLVVEDEKIVPDEIAEVIANKGIRVTSVHSGQEGFELLDRLNTDASIALPPVVIHTAMDLNQEQRAYLDRYAHSVVCKSPDSLAMLADQTAKFFNNLTRPSTEPAAHLPVGDMADVVSGRKILVVDDDMRNTFALSGALEESGAEKVVIAGDGQLAFDTLEKDADFDLIVMDIMMPVRNGFEAMTRIRQNDHWAEVHIISLTAMTSADGKEKCLNAGADRFLTKPVNVEQLVSVAAELLEERQSVLSNSS